ncbi:Pentatricopeptide repeat-containing protein [Babesia sp. Xinjiang]|uniref:Pentatricopeptide repeat-containing protein n=1 Tax=Babesia sp. Xinjiang TaxID=462227 RepID=UPI000A262C90|nr:Pentatricopeptide repeat-containing protein [Babesia sp. Xinjiang]ORM42332.1 Pentatricopeptide repeat-containing protein [Babesia sp. Xinjiang]
MEVVAVLSITQYTRYPELQGTIPSSNTTTGSIKCHAANNMIKNLASRGDLSGAVKLISDMRSLGHSITKETYQSLLLGCTNTHTVETARYIYLCLIADGLSPGLETYTLLIKAHVSAGDLSSAFTLYRKMEKEGLEADLNVFTVLIEGLIAKGHTENAWRLYNYIRTWRLIEPNETLFTTMIRACVPSKNAEKAMMLYEEMQQMEICPTTDTYEALIHCLSRRRAYAHKCFVFYNLVKSNEAAITYNTFLYLFRACETLGNTRKAKDILQYASALGITVDTTLAIAIARALMSDLRTSDSSFHKISCIRKAWNVIHSLLPLKRQETSKLLNTLIELYEIAGYYDYALDVVSYFPRLEAKPDRDTYSILLRILAERLQDPGRFFALWSRARSTIIPDRDLLNMALKMAMISNSSKRTVDILEQMYTYKVYPSSELMHMLYSRGKHVSQVHVMINKLTDLHKSQTYERKKNESQMTQTFIEENRLRRVR